MKAHNIFKTIIYTKGIKLKRHSHLYEKIYDIDNIIMAHHEARKGKSHYRGVKKVNKNEIGYCQKISNMLKDKTYIIDENSYQYMSIIDKGKQRDIYKLPYYPHRIIQWAIMLQLEPIFKKMFISDTYASIKGRGIHDALRKIKNVVNKNKNIYCLKLDIQKYYPSIDNKILYKMIENKFKDKELLKLLEYIIFSLGDKGQPIGSLLSQYLGNFYLTKFDHWVKEELRIKHYYRYCDDMVILLNDKDELHNIRCKIDKYLKEELNLKLKENYQVFPVGIRGIDFLGYRIYPHFTLLRKRNAVKMKKRIVKIKKYNVINYSAFCSINSFMGWLKHCDSYNFIIKYFVDFNNKLFCSYNGDIEHINIKI